MDEIYSHLKNKAHKSNLVTGVERQLEDLMRLNPLHVSERQVIDAFIYELKLLLTRENLAELIEQVFQLEHRLEKLSLYLRSLLQVPVLDEFYRLLSPILLRSIHEHAQDKDASALVVSFKNAIRVAIEEELYLHKNTDH